MRAQSKELSRTKRKSLRWERQRVSGREPLPGEVKMALRAFRRWSGDQAEDTPQKPPKTEITADGKKIVTEYSKDDRIARISKYSKTGRLISRVEPSLSGGFSHTEFDANGKPREITIYGPDSRAVSKKTYATDPQGNRTVRGRIYDYDANGKRTGDHTIEETFDKNTGKLIRREEEDYSNDGPRSTRRIVEYGPKGNATGGKLIEDFGKVGAEEYQTTTEFDGDGEVISVTHKHASKDVLVEETVTEYEDGKPTKRTTTEHDPDGSLKRQKTTEWDEDGKVKKRTTLEFLAKGGRIETETEYRHGKNGAVTSTTITESRYAANGKRVARPSYTTT